MFCEGSRDEPHSAEHPSERRGPAEQRVSARGHLAAQHFQELHGLVACRDADGGTGGGERSAVSMRGAGAAPLSDLVARAAAPERERHMRRARTRRAARGAAPVSAARASAPAPALWSAARRV